MDVVVFYNKCYIYIYIYITDLIIDTFIHSNKNVVSNWLLKRGGMEESVFGTAGKVCLQLYKKIIFFKKINTKKRKFK
tara:strand:- start:109 stop:342 length:234 start_codon:yes stop_codon:yes gene_type:complete